MHRVISVKALPDFSVHVQFADGLEKQIDLRPFIRGGVSAALNDWAFFQQVMLEDGGGIAWANGFDFCPEFLHEYAETK